MENQLKNVLFLCTGNTARSIMAEGILRKDGQGRFASYSAGSIPNGVVNPLSLKTLSHHGYPAIGFESKSWDQFAGAQAPKLDFIFTVCGNAASETCPIWPGHPASAHWGVDDPAAVEGSDKDKEEAFENAFISLRMRIAAFLDLPINSLSPTALKASLRAIGQLPFND